MTHEDATDLEILRLHRAGHSDAHIARAVRLSRQRVTIRRTQIITEDCLVDPAAHDYWYAPKETST